MDMTRRQIGEGVFSVGAADPGRKLFDALVPLPDGTSYNSYLVRGSEKTALLDAVDPSKMDELFGNLGDVPELDYVVAHHAEQDHSGGLPALLERFPNARLVATARAKGMLMDLLPLAEDRILAVADGDRLSLGDKTLHFIHWPWVHWPETMVSYLPEDRLLFTCDLFGSHLATNDPHGLDEARITRAAKRYFAEIMMPFRAMIQKNMDKLNGLEIDMIAPSHGPVHDQPARIVAAYRAWVSDTPRNAVVLPFVSMHGSTRLMAQHLASALADRGVGVEMFDLEVADIGEMAAALIDAATLVIGAPTVLGGPHPSAAAAAYLVRALRPPLKFAAVIGSYGWGAKALEQLVETLSALKMEVLPAVVSRGTPKPVDLGALDDLAGTIAARHGDLGLLARPRG
jgi:flavorubredoxin